MPEGGARPPRVLGIAGSPRRNGNSERLLDACLGGVEAVGIPAEKLVVADYGIRPCTGCMACMPEGECTLVDRMHEVYAKLDGASAIIVASPVYFATVPAVLKALYDRCEPYWVRRYELGLPQPPRRPGALLLARGGGDPFGFDAAIATTRSVFAVLGLDYAGELRVSGVDAAGDVAGRPEELERARALGEGFARGLTGS